MKLNGKMVLIVMFIFLLFQNFNFADEYEYNYTHPIGLKKVKFDSGNKEQKKYWRRNYEYKWWLVIENLRDFTDIKKWMEESGIEYNNNNLEEVTNGIHECIKKMWLDAINMLLNCDTFINHYNGDSKKKFLENLEDNPRPIQFRPSGPDFDSATVAGTNAWSSVIYLHFNDLEKIARYYSKKIKDNDTNIDDFNDEEKNSHFHELTGFLGHEMLHMFADLQGGLSYGEESPEQIRSECEVHCIQAKCLDKNHTMPYHECDGEGVDIYCDNNKKCEFKKCNKINPPSLASTTSLHSDHGDDNFSYASSLPFLLDSTTLALEDYTIPTDKDFLSLNYYPDILIYNKFNYRDMPLLLDKFTGFSYINDYNLAFFSNNHKVLVIPSGELMGDEDSEIIKNAIRLFAESGGTVVALAQQYGEHFENLMPVTEGEIFFHTNYSPNIYFYRTDYC